MENDYFIYKTHIEFAITSTDVSPEVITEEVEITPTRCFHKGDLIKSNFSHRIGYQSKNLWAITSKPSERTDETISHHIGYLKSILFPKINILGRYKKSPHIDTSFWIWIRTNNAGIGLEMDEDEMSFLNSVANWVHFSLITGD